MWISKKKYMDLIERIRELEEFEASLASSFETRLFTADDKFDISEFIKYLDMPLRVWILGDGVKSELDNYLSRLGVDRRRADH